MGRAHAAAEMEGAALAREVQERRGGELRLHQAADRVRRAGAGGGDHDAEPAGRAGEAVGHVGSAGLPARADHADAVPLGDGVHHGNVVDGDDAEGGVRADGGEEFRDEVGDGVGHARPQSKRPAYLRLSLRMPPIQRS
jgi:hypothetical protein